MRGRRAGDGADGDAGPGDEADGRGTLGREDEADGADGRRGGREGDAGPGDEADGRRGGREARRAGVPGISTFFGRFSPLG